MFVFSCPRPCQISICWDRIHFLPTTSNWSFVFYFSASSTIANTNKAQISSALIWESLISIPNRKWRAHFHMLPPIFDLFAKVERCQIFNCTSIVVFPLSECFKSALTSVQSCHPSHLQWGFASICTSPSCLLMVAVELPPSNSSYTDRRPSTRGTWHLKAKKPAHPLACLPTTLQ